MFKNPTDIVQRTVRLCPHSLLVFLFLIVAGLLAGEPGELLQIKEFPGKEWSDFARDSADGFWVLGASDGKIYHVDSSLELISGDTIDHPFGAGVFPTFKPVCRGLAYVPAEHELIVLNSTTLEIARCSPQDGSQTGETVSLQPPNESLIESLSYDPNNGVLWAVDSAGDRILAFDSSTGECVQDYGFPGDSPPETHLYGTAVSYLNEGNKHNLYLLWGDIFQEKAAALKILDAQSGEEGLFSISLSALCQWSIVSLLAGSQQLFLLCNSDDGSAISLVDSQRPAVLPPSNIEGSARKNGDVALQWQNNGNGENGAYTEISIRLDGNALAQLGGAENTFVHEGAPDGELMYEIRPRENMTQGISGTARVVNGRGAVLDWIPFPGRRASAIAVDPGTGAVWVADGKPLEGNVYRIFRFGSGLEMADSIQVTLTGSPSGMTFWPDSDAVDPPETLLVVVNEEKNAMQKFRKDGTAVGGAIPIRLPETKTKDSARRVGSVAWDPDNGDYLFAVLDKALNRIVWVDRYGFPAEEGTQGVKVSCTPPGTSGIVPESGIAKSRQSGFFQVGISNGTVHELNNYCNATKFDLNPHLPRGPFAEVKLKDFDYANEVVYLTSPATNTVFKILAYPLGHTFLRGDPNSDGTVDIGDVAFALAYLFEEKDGSLCTDAADANDDGMVDISDPVYLLFFLFGEGPPPPVPFPDAGHDQTLVDDLSC